ncbi:cytochrome p450 monooxygenase [Grosmannia clavigera kw1407]|uniref:Cytochrome p450 monooxygenase n=1 Tax=Grosmannia clavigera (strain kw1407 / UAMH 11150) TaxID=655863 RepID=F0XQT5_GROCL|nr:cytochrome p450 monooxygenase [Grosmannia clavigera kw1407]EFX00004.1 cytochrome p450 monooxygenase [Grosmannia clavigera kw1407]
MDVFRLPTPTVIGLVGILALAVVYLNPRVFGKRKYNFPPGPPGEFLLGHYRKIPFTAPFKQYAKWSKEYDSEVLYFETFGTKWIVPNSLQSAIDLLDKRGVNYSDRPKFILFEEMGWAPTLTWLRWGPQMQRHRRVLQPAFSKTQVRQHQDSQQKEALICLHNILDDAENWTGSIRQFAVAIVLNIAFGIDVDGPCSPWIKTADDAADAIGHSGAPARSIVDQFPATRHLPTWLPFMERLRYARNRRWAIEAITNIPFAQARKEVEEKIHKKCFAHDRLHVYNHNVVNGVENEFTMDDIRGSSAAIYIAGNDTTATTVILFVLYLMQNPDVQAKAQEEIDRVVGNERLPTWEDISDLPYMNLVLQETFQIYAEPFKFWPERYLANNEGGNGEPLPVGNFGFGRRVCIGRALAENSLLIVLASMLATMKIEFPLDKNGDRTLFEPEWPYLGQAPVYPPGLLRWQSFYETQQLLRKPEVEVSIRYRVGHRVQLRSAREEAAVDSGERGVKLPKSGIMMA